MQKHHRTPTHSYFPNCILQTHENKEVRFYDDLIKNRIVVINMFYAQCEGICPGMTANLLKVQKLLGERVGKDIFMYSLTLKPEQDSVSSLHHYAMMHRLRPGWQLLRGSVQDTELLRVKLGFTDPDPDVDRDTSSHIGMVRFGNDAIGSWGACPSLAKPEQLVRSILWMDVSSTKKPRH